MRQPQPPRNLYTLLAALVVIACTLLSPSLALAKGCTEGSPAVAVPSTFWGELRPVHTIVDTTRYNGSQRADSNHPLINYVDIENGFLFATYWGGLQIWDARGGNATQPTRLSQADGWSNHFPRWIPGNSEIDQYVYAVDAPEGNDNFAAVGGLGPAGLSIWDTSNKTTPKALYQDVGKDVQQVYAAMIGGRAYAFAASFVNTTGLFVYDMTEAKARNYNKCIDEPGHAGTCAGVYKGRVGEAGGTQYVHGTQFGNRHFVVKSSGSGLPRGLEIWEVTNPTSPVKVVGSAGTFTAGVALWEHNGSAYLAVRELTKLKIYNVTGCLTGGCSSLPSTVGESTVLRNADSDVWKSVIFSRSGSTPFLFLGHHDLCHDDSTLAPHSEYLYDVSNPAQPRDITPPQKVVDPNRGNRTVDYWTWYYSDNFGGFSYSAPRVGKFSGPYFYRADLSIFDIHEWTAGSGAPPVANFTWSPSEIYPGDAVTFTDTSTGGTSSRSWAFQDGSPASGSSSPQVVTFTSPGNKTVQLQATRNNESDSETKSVTVLDPTPIVGSVAPTAAASLYACQPVTFTATATGRAALSYSWKLLNPTNATGVTGSGSTFQWDGKINGVAAVPGQYRGEVTVQNASGNATGLSAVITIKTFEDLPNAGFTISNAPFTNGTVTFTAPTVGVTSWQWDFDDDANPSTQNWVTLTDPVTGPNPTHSYTSTGQRTVRVRVSNCATPAAVESAPLSVNITQIAPLRINQFQALCNVAPCLFAVNESITFAQAVEGEPTQYRYDWDGNGNFEQTSATPVTTHTYPSAGSYAPKMQIVRGAELSAIVSHPQFTVSGNVTPPPPPPTPTINIGGATSGQINTAVTFTASTSNCTASASGWTWTTGGGTGSSTSNSITITWSNTGSKTITAKNSGCQSATGTKTVTISDGTTNPPPPPPGGLAAIFTATPGTGTAVSFDASASTGTPAIYSWDFGDGQTASGSDPRVSHTYAGPGTYTVKLEVGKAGTGCPFGFCSATTSKPVTVSGNANPVLLAAFTTSASCVSEFGFSTCTVERGQAVTFTSSSTGATTHSWTFGDGGTATGNQVTHTWTQPGNYRVDLTAGNGQSTATAFKSFVVTGAPTASNKSIVLPWIAQTRGALNQSSDLYVYNPGSSEMEVKLQFRKRGVPESAPPEITKKIAAGATLFVADALDDLFNRENVAGFISITVVKGDVEPVITSFNTTFQPDGSEFGQTVPGFSMSRTGSAAGSGAPSPVQHLVGLNDNGERLAYFGLSNPSDQPVSYRLRFFDKDGKAIGTSADTRLLSRFGQRQYQVSEIRGDFNVTDVDDYRIEIETVSGGGLVPYASNLRLASDDPSFVSGGAVQASKVYLIGALSQPGPNNSLWQSDVVISNTANEVVLTDVTFTPNGLNSVTTSAVKLTLQPGATERLVNIVADKWGIKDSAGVLVLDSDALKGVFPVVQGESYDNSKPAKRFGQTLPAFTDEDAAVPGKGHYLVGLRQDAKNRTTYWIYNPGTTTGEYDIIYRALDGSILGRIDGVRLGPGKARQVSPAQHPLPTTGVTGGFTVQFVVKAGKLFSAAQVVNNATNDPAYVKGELR